MSSGQQSSPEATGQQEPDGGDDSEGLSDYIDENREKMEGLADGEYPISPAIQLLVDRRDRGEL